jgi:hypothetical protein
VRSDRVALVLVATIATMLPGCGREGSTASNVDTGATGTESSPITPGPVPDGYQLVTAGIGTQSQHWGDDSNGTDEPFTVLAPSGADAGSPDAVVVSVTGYAGYEGDLEQAAGAHPPVAQPFTVDGRRAIFTPPGAEGVRGTTAGLVVAVDDDLAVRVRADATKDELVEVFRRTQPSADRREAPTISEPPEGLHVVGSVDADAIVGLRSFVLPFSDEVPGTERAHAVAWVRGEPTTNLARSAPDALVVLSIPGGATDVEALPGFAVQPMWTDLTVETVRADDEVVTVLDGGDAAYRARAVFRRAPWGDVILALATGTQVPAAEELTNLVVSTQRAAPSDWEAFVVAATGGPGLHADADGIELVRGRVGELEWLFQARPAAELSSMLPNEATGYAADPCLKLSNRHRVCVRSGGGSPPDEVVLFPSVDLEGRHNLPYDVPSFVVMTTRTAGAQVRVTTATDAATADLVPHPGDGRFSAVVFVDDPGYAVCGDVPDGLSPPASMNLMRIEVLDAAGAVVGCAGARPGPPS